MINTKRSIGGLNIMVVDHTIPGPRIRYIKKQPKLDRRAGRKRQKRVELPLLEYGKFLINKVDQWLIMNKKSYKDLAASIALQDAVEVKAGSCPEPWIQKVMETPPPTPPKYKNCTVGASGYIWPEAQRLIKPKTPQGVYTLHPTA